MSKRDVLFLCQFFYPENNSSATLPFDTARFLVKKGYSVDALCGFPKEYTEQKEIPEKETVNGIRIQRMRYIQLDRKKKLSRLVNYFSFTVSALMRVFKLRKYKCVVTYSNPPVLPFVPALANLLFGTRFVFVAYDVYPEIAYASGAIQKGDLIDRVAKWLNHMVYNRAAKIVALTDEMRQFILNNRKHLPADCVVTIPNWAHEEMLPDAAFASAGKTGGDAPFVVSYIGNMGTCQEMETFAGGIERLRDREDIGFQFVGHGNKSMQLKERLACIRNVRFFDFLTGDALEKAVQDSSCFVVSLEKGIRGMCAPSKYYTYLYSGKPIIAVMEKESYLFEEVEKQKIGYGIEIGDVDTLVNALCSMAKDERRTREMGAGAAALYSRNYTAEQASERYCKLIEDVLH